MGAVFLLTGLSALESLRTMKNTIAVCAGCLGRLPAVVSLASASAVHSRAQLKSAKMRKSLSCLLIVLSDLLLTNLPTENAAAANPEQVTHFFAGGSDGGDPYGSLIMDERGNFYGTTAGGGGGTECGSGTDGCGTVYKLSRGQVTVLYAFAGGSDGYYPRKGLFLDSQGNLYGTTTNGGESDLGTVFRLAPDGTKTTLHSFSGGSDGSFPSTDLVPDVEGNLYGTTLNGGGGPCPDGCGTLFSITPEGQESMTYSFKGANQGDGAAPAGGLVMDLEGNFYGATYHGGNNSCSGGGCGTVFKVTPQGAETVLYKFAGGTDGNSPNGDLIMDESGNLYGTTSLGGSSTINGTVFKVTPDGTHSVLYSFRGGTDGSLPSAGLIADTQGNLYGTTSLGGDHNFGVVFKVAPNGREKILHSFAGGSTDGWDSRASLTMDRKGNLYGTTILGGTANRGTVFQVKN